MGLTWNMWQLQRDKIVVGVTLNYTLFVDESGQSEITKIRDEMRGGASPYMTMAGVLVPNSKLVEYRLVLQRLVDEFGKKDLHCSKLNHVQIVRFAKVLASCRVKIFAVISRKETLGEYREEIGKNDKLYYNKCAQYLLERVGRFMATHDLKEEHLEVIFEDGGFDYGRLRALISKCRRTPRNAGTEYLRYVNPYSIQAKPKGEEPLLQFADLVAHGFFKCVDDGPSSFGVFETRYVAEIKDKIFADPKSGDPFKWGIFPIHSWRDLKLNEEVLGFFTDLRVEKANTS